uniref:Uncharacterized protein n=1 Tax=Aegilops tauschii subsp. strangulata TaxID=200361 RepID=A0A453FGS2_AEGTS
MGKNQAYKAMQWARLGSSSGASRRRGGRRHEWHAVRLVSLNKTHTLTWEEFKKEKVCAAALDSLSAGFLGGFSFFTL